MSEKKTETKRQRGVKPTEDKVVDANKIEVNDAKKVEETIEDEESDDDGIFTVDDTEVETDAPIETEVEEVETMKCLGLENHNCKIGGVSYTIEKNIAIQLPINAAMVLQRASKVIVR